MDNSESSKHCARCGYQKPITDFTKHPNAKDGRRRQCKDCLQAHYREYSSTLSQEHDDVFYANAINDPTQSKWCPKCEQTKHVSQFHRNRYRSDGFKAHCADCIRLNRPPDERRNRYDRARALASYGMTEADYDRLLKKQRGACAICEKPPDADERLAVDHCHQGGHVRGLLCRNCNTGIGMLQDDPAIAIKAADYLLRL